LPLQGRERNYHSISPVPARTPSKENSHYVKNRGHMLRVGVSFVPRRNLELRRSTQTREFRHAKRNASTDDRRKWERDDERRSQWIERKQRPNDKIRGITVRRWNKLFLSDSCFQRAVAQSRTGLDRAGSTRPTGSAASCCAECISQAAG